MNYTVRVLARAQLDLDDILAYIAKRSPEGAARLLASFEETLALLEDNPLQAPLAPESQRLDDEVRHCFFRTRAGRIYRALFVIAGHDIFVLRVRGPGQRPLRRGELDIPPAPPLR